MALDLLSHCTLAGPALTEPFVRFELERELNNAKLLPKTTGKEGQELQESWDVYRRKLRELAMMGGALRVKNHVIEPLAECLGYEQVEAATEVETREGKEPGGYLLQASDGAQLRVWCTSLDEDLEAPSKRGAAYRYSYLKIAQRVLLASGERLGLLTNGMELRLLISDPARPDSQIIIPIDPHWKRARTVPDSYRLVLALASPAGIKAIPKLVDKARLQQARVTKELRVQARLAVERFVQEVLERPENRNKLAQMGDLSQLAKQLWREGLITVYRLLFILKLETSDNLAQSFSFASTSLWRNTFSPTVALARYAPEVLYKGWETGSLLENGLRTLFKMFAEGLECTELNVKPLGGTLFGADATPVLSQLRWGEWAVAHLLDQLLWTAKKRGSDTRERVHYGPLDVEDLGRVYEALLELEPGITSEPMCRLRRQKLEVVVPVAQGEKYRPVTPVTIESDIEVEEEEETAEEEEEEAPKRGKKTKVEWIEEIPPGRFYLRVGLGRKATGSYYTPHSFVRFLVQETLGTQVEECSPKENPNPQAILKLKVLDPAMGSGHFLVQACRFLGEKLYEACRLCDERATAAQKRGETAKTEAAREAALKEALEFRQRVVDLPDPDDKLVKYLPSSAPEGQESGLSQKEAEALCRRLVAVHCLYGVDKNPLAVELAKLSLWIESHAEGLPLTFLDHRFVVGDSLTGPFFEHLLKYPGSQEPIDGLFVQGIRQQFTQQMAEALKHIRDLEATVGADISEIEAKQAAKQRLDIALAPFKIAAAAWTGGVMLGGEDCDDVAYSWLLDVIGKTGNLPDDLSEQQQLLPMIARGLAVEEVPSMQNELLALLVSGKCIPAVPYDLTFAEVFYSNGTLDNRQGFDAVLGNPPWDRMLPADKEFFAAYDFNILEAPTKRERIAIEKRLKNEPKIAAEHTAYLEEFRQTERVIKCLYKYQIAIIKGEKTIGKQDAFRAFMERNALLLKPFGWTGVVVPAAFHVAEGATGIRRLYLEKMELRYCFSFQNKRKIFDIVSNVKFAVVAARMSSEGTQSFSCAFYLHNDEWLFDNLSERKPLVYTLDFVHRTGGEYLSLIELQSEEALEIAKVCFANGIPFGKVCESLNIRIGREMNMTDDSWRFTPTSEVVGQSDPRDYDYLNKAIKEGYLIVSEDDSIHLYTDHWTERPRYLTHVTSLIGKEKWVKASKFFRLFFRRIATVVDARSFMVAVVPPGWLSASPQAHRCTGETPTYIDLVLLSILNSYVTDWNLRLKITSTVNLFIAEGVPIPASYCNLRAFLAHSALRLTCNHSGYEPLWREQFGATWREPHEEPFTFPVLATDDERWQVRAAIDAVVANAYGLNRNQYAHILSTFSHKSYPQAPPRCLAYFDELQAIGLEAFTKKYDPYWDIPLNENLPQPVIDLPIPDAVTEEQQLEISGLSVASEAKTKKRTTKTRKGK
ncbi:N-6 DNA methylase [Tolypothrix sp. FACHB-123]|uniref:N-6 DNA methylase n=1 Tax=Tolypothrix sp. FACHB-123 TaxID=2692868 RepID=UPI00168A0930|nr:N-6 DNA methylase [Tolypothrix sp. FACHB-123]MBD2358144.1 N-6 DNA methylase [Tolypothrix sp. FACHB-123]